MHIHALPRRAFTLISPSEAAAQVDVLTQHQDASRSGANLKETDLTVEKVDIKQKNQFGKLCFRLVEGNVYAQPLIVTGAKVAGSATPRDVVIIATEHNFLYALRRGHQSEFDDSATLVDRRYCLRKICPKHDPQSGPWAWTWRMR